MYVITLKKAEEKTKEKEQGARWANQGHQPDTLPRRNRGVIGGSEEERHGREKEEESGTRLADCASKDLSCTVPVALCVPQPIGTVLSLCSLRFGFVGECLEVSAGLLTGPTRRMAT